MALVVLAMSGGVDSSVAAKLLLDAGHDVVGVFMRHGVPASECNVQPKSPPSQQSNLATTRPLPPNLELPIISSNRLGHKQGCCTAQDAEDARRVAGMFQIPFYALDLNAEFGRIMDYFVSEYSQGRTPNPCVMCNHLIKFGHLFEYADSIGADCIATGHYARISQNSSGEKTLHRGLDNDKDQAYVLFGIERQNLARVELPVGGFHKSEIRKMATDWNLRVANKKDSQEICFVDAGKHPEFVAARTGASSSGEIITTDGTVVGQHPGIEHFTIGQRKGLRVAFGEPMFVIKIEPETRRVVVGRRDQLTRPSLTAHTANWLSEPPNDPFACLVQIRYNGQAHQATVQMLEGGRFQVDFDAPCEAVAPGQAAVCFLGDQLLGGGWIE